MSNETRDYCSCGPACACSPCVCRSEAEPTPRAACCEDDRSSSRKSGCSCGC